MYRIDFDGSAAYSVRDRQTGHRIVTSWLMIRDDKRPGEICAHFVGSARQHNSGEMADLTCKLADAYRNAVNLIEFLGGDVEHPRRVGLDECVRALTSAEEIYVAEGVAS